MIEETLLADARQNTCALIDQGLDPNSDLKHKNKLIQKN
jgi:hypothetical protein